MNYFLYSFFATDLARQRAEEAARERFASAPFENGPSSPNRIRRSVARVLAAVSRASASAVRRLDDCIADDLGRSLAPTE